MATPAEHTSLQGTAALRLAESAEAADGACPQGVGAEEPSLHQLDALEARRRALAVLIAVRRAAVHIGMPVVGRTSQERTSPARPTRSARAARRALDAVAFARHREIGRGHRAVLVAARRACSGVDDRSGKGPLRARVACGLASLGDNARRAATPRLLGRRLTVRAALCRVSRAGRAERP